MILIVTNRQDQTADYLILELKRRNVEYFRFNTEDFPKKVSVTWSIDNLGLNGYFDIANRRIQFDNINSIWYRRPVTPVPCESLDTDSRDFAIVESLSALDGIWKTLDCFWVSNPHNIRQAENKLLQLKQAVHFGFHIPQTVITNNPDASKLFYVEQDKDIIYKPLRKGRINRGEDQNVIFTNPIDVHAAAQFEKVKYAPSLFQKYIHKRLELRVTVIGENVYTVSIDSQKYPNAIHDWRRALHNNIPHKIFSLPHEIEHKCRVYVKSLGLKFGAIDMIVTHDEQFVFLEINPNGQWAWIQQMCPAIPLRESLANILINGKQ